ncbi:uncharacterized protein HD556DRAFT_1191128, partial [Suillus plorans]
TEILLCNPRAIAHFCAREMWTFPFHWQFWRHQYVSAIIFPRLFYISCQIGRGLLWSQDETHRGQRKALAPAFSNAGIQKLIPVFW